MKKHELIERIEYLNSEISGVVIRRKMVEKIIEHLNLERDDLLIEQGELAHEIESYRTRLEGLDL